MKRQTISLLLSAMIVSTCLVATGAGCGESGSDVKWPDKPADGCPVAMEFIAMDGTGKKAKAKVRLFNFSDKDVKGVQMTLSYLDAKGAELDTFPWSQMANPKLVGKKSHVEKKIGAFIKDGTTRVSATFREVEFADGTKWTASGE